jgi:hypothetical protein
MKFTAAKKPSGYWLFVIRYWVLVMCYQDCHNGPNAPVDDNHDQISSNEYSLYRLYNAIFRFFQ